MKAGKWIAAGVVAGALALGAPATAAPGDTTLRGETDEGAKVKLVVGNAGNATKFRLGKTEIECKEGGTLSNKAGVYTDFVTSDPGEFKIKTTSENSSGGFDFETKSKIRGFAADDFESWGGTLKLKTNVFEGGSQVDVCTLKTNWTVE